MHDSPFEHDQASIKMQCSRNVCCTMFMRCEANRVKSGGSRCLDEAQMRERESLLGLEEYVNQHNMRSSHDTMMKKNPKRKTNFGRTIKNV